MKSAEHTRAATSHGSDFRARLSLWPVFMSYMLSFIYVGVYWNRANMHVTRAMEEKYEEVSGCCANDF